MVVQVREMAAKMAAEKQAQQAAEAAAHAERQAGTAPPLWCDLSQMGAHVQPPISMFRTKQYPADIVLCSRCVHVTIVQC